MVEAGNVMVFFDIKIGKNAPQRIEIELYAKDVPKTAENFRSLCVGDKVSSKLLHKNIKG